MNGQTMLIGNLSDRQQLLFCIAGTPALVGRIFNGDYAGFRVPVVVRPKSPFYHPGIQLPAVADQGPQLYGREEIGRASCRERVKSAVAAGAGEIKKARTSSSKNIDVRKTSTA